MRAAGVHFQLASVVSSREGGRATAAVESEETAAFMLFPKQVLCWECFRM
jgi:hypothetical protein